MTRVGARGMGLSMTAGAVLAFWVVYGVVQPQPLGASECCQVCEAKEAACYNTCSNMSHNESGNDSLGACYEACDEALYYDTYACWAHCSYCGEPPSPQQCFTYVNWHYTYCDFYVGQQCVSWDTVHEVYAYETYNSGFCTP